MASVAEYALVARHGPIGNPARPRDARAPTLLLTASRLSRHGRRNARLCVLPRSFSTTQRAARRRYCPIYLFNNALPLHLRYRDEHVIVSGFVPLYVPPPSAAPKLAELSATKRDEWLKGERLSLNDAAVGAIISDFDRLSGGVKVRQPGGKHRVVVPVIGAWQLDHPAHMQFCQCRLCGFCDVSGGGKRSLAEFDYPVEMRSSDLVKPHVQRYLAAVKRGGLPGADRDEKREAKSEANAARQTVTAMGVNPWYNRMWDARYVDAYLNVSLSPLHILKGNYKDVIQWSLEAVCTHLCSKSACQRWLRRVDSVVIQQLACFSIVTGSIKRKGLSGILTYASRGGPFVVRGGSKVPPHLSLLRPPAFAAQLWPALSHGRLSYRV